MPTGGLELVDDRVLALHCIVIVNMTKIIRRGWRFYLGLFLLTVSIVALLAGLYAVSTKTFRLPWAAAPNSSDFSFVIIPDSQNESMTIQKKMVDWIIAHKDEKNIVLVLHAGDLTNNNEVGVWEKIVNTYRPLPKSVATVVSMGNHDMVAQTYNPSNFNAYMGQLFATTPYDGSFQSNDKTNTYRLLSVGDQPYVVLNLEFGPRDEVLTWANSILTQYRNRIGVIITHAYMNHDDTRLSPGDTYNPHYYKDTYGWQRSVNDGEEMWNKLVKQNTNVRLVFSGHILNDGAGRMADRNNDGKEVYQMLSNYQEQYGGGGGYMRIVTFSPKDKKMYVKTYSPVTDQYLRDSQNEFVYDIDFLVPYTAPLETPTPLPTTTPTVTPKPTPGVFVTGKCISGQTKPYYRRVGNQCRKINRCGVSNCWPE